MHISKSFTAFDIQLMIILEEYSLYVHRDKM